MDHAFNPTCIASIKLPAPPSQFITSGTKRRTTTRNTFGAVTVPATSVNPFSALSSVSPTELPDQMIDGGRNTKLVVPENSSKVNTMDFKFFLNSNIVGEPTPRKKEKKKRKAVDARQPLVTSWMSNATPAHVSHTAASPISSTHSHHVLGGKKTGVSRLLQQKEKITSIETGKQYRMADLFSSDDEN